MSPSKDILLSDSRSDHQKAINNIFYTYYYLVDKINDQFKKYDITRQQFNVLHILKVLQPEYASVNLIKARMLDKMSDVSRIVERLRLKGLVLRQSAEKDKRSVQVIITPKGLTLLDSIDPELDLLGKLVGNLTPEETCLLNKMLDKIRMNEDASGVTGLVAEASDADTFAHSR
ncbi:MAG TPA: MarR family transcriptional regulator [Chryseolinea sp.]|nr:MarR family transcriptional regulator [Chryseolinea sp.]